MMTKHPRFLLLALGVAISATGCRMPFAKTEPSDAGLSPLSKVKVVNPLEWGVDPDEPRSGEPHRVVATWSDTVRQTQGESPERGFGGRVYFYDQGADPITVQGQLVVYAFDETGRAPTDPKPTKRYVFPVDQLPKHMSVSELGPSYSVWLPWGTVNGPPTDVSLIARFEPVRGGELIVSDQARQRLPGHGLAPAQDEGTMIAQRPTPGRVQQAGFVDEPAAPAKPAQVEEPRQRLSTTTIKLKR